MIRLLIADDHPVVRDGLRGMVAAEQDLEVVGEAATGGEALALVPRVRPDVALVDLRMPELDGVATIRALRERHPDVRVLVLTTFDSDRDVVSAIEAGATGYLLKDAPRAELFRAIRAAARGEAVLAPAAATRLVGQLRQPATPPADRPRAAGAGRDDRGQEQRRDRARALPVRGHGEDAREASVQEAGRLGPRARGGARFPVGSGPLGGPRRG